jgi:quinol monooxygenase YgiN
LNFGCLLTLQQLLKTFKEITEFSQAEEPTTLRYLTCVPLDASNETSIYMVEEYVFGFVGSMLTLH